MGIKVIVLIISLFLTRASFFELSGPYFGQKPPGKEPALFAPGIVNFGLFTRDVAMTPDGKEFYFCVGFPGFSRSAILEMHMIQGKWTAPEVAPFSSDPRWRYLEPCISPDGKEFFFTSDRPANPSENKADPFGIWIMKRLENGWGMPRRLDDFINGPTEAFFPSVTQDGTLYFCRWGDDKHGTIWRARRGANGYLLPEKLPKEVNSGENRTNAFVSPDESYVILPLFGREDSLGGSDYYIVFRRPNDTWYDPVNLGPVINTPSNGEISAFVSRDSRHLFFMSARIRRDLFSPGETLTIKKLKMLADQPGANGDAAIYWVDAKIIEELRPNKMK